MLLGKGILPGAPSEEVLVSGGGDGRIVLWSIDGANGGAISSLYTLEDGREEGESILSLVRDGTFLYSGRFAGEVNVWDLETRQLVRSLKADTGDVLALSLGGGHLFASGISGNVQVKISMRLGKEYANDLAEIQPTLRDNGHLQSPRRPDTGIGLLQLQRKATFCHGWQ